MPRPTKGQLQKTGGKLQISEDQLQALCVQWFKLRYPKLSKAIYAVPNGGLRNKIVAAKLKKTGLQKGVSDLVLPYPSRGYHGAYMETKIKPNRPTVDQDEFLKLMSEFGHATTVFYSFDEFEQFIRWYLDDQDSKRFIA